MTRIGELRHYIEVWAFTVTEDVIGNQIVIWKKAGGAWAIIEPLGGEERLVASIVRAETTHKVTMRHLAGITPANQLIFGSRIFEIESILNVEEKNREMVLMCKEKIGEVWIPPVEPSPAGGDGDNDDNGSSK